MKSEVRKDGGRERRILTGMIVNDEMVARVAPRWDGKLFNSSWANTIGGWCVDHHRKYKKSIGKGVQNEFIEWADSRRDEDEVQTMSSFLESLSSAYESECNVAHSFDIAVKHFNRVRVKRLKNELEADLANNDDDKSLVRIADFAKMEAANSSGTDLWWDPPFIDSVFAGEGLNEQLVKYKGALGEFFDTCFNRNSLVAFCAPQKVGKTWMLIDVAYRALLQRRRVAFFAIGDMSIDEVALRFLIRAAGHPEISKTGQWPYTVKRPVSIETSPIPGTTRREILMGHRELEFDTPINAEIAKKAASRLWRKQIRSEKPLFSLKSFPNRAISIEGIKDEVVQLESSGWGIPDVLIVDYADNLGPVDKREDYRNSINTTWQGMSTLRLEYHCSLVTATQVNAKGFDVEWLGRQHFSEDNRKLNQVTAMVGINQNEKEKEDDSFRLNYIVKRKGFWGNTKGVHVASCLPIGNPAVKSSW